MFGSNPYKNILLYLGLFSLFLSAARAGEIPVNKTGPGFAFTQNAGQWNADIRYRFSSSNLDIHVKSNSISYFIFEGNAMALIGKHAHIEHPEISSINSHFIKLNFLGSNPNTYIENEKRASYYYNYFNGKDPGKWKSNIPVYKKLIYKKLYPGIDLNLEGNSFDKGLKYDWIISPNTDINNIQMQFEGAVSVKEEYGDLYIYHSLGYMRENRPYAYQIINGIEVQVLVKYKVNGNKAGFEITGNYNKNFELIIDPDLIFSTYSGSSADNFGFTATYDSKGNLYAGGIAGVLYGTFNVTPGAFQTAYKGGVGRLPVGLACDIAYSKYSSDGTQLLYSTYFGGSDDDYPHSFVVDKNDNLIIMGSTYSSDFPTGSNAYDSTYNGGSDILVAKFNEAGTILIGSTYIGGTLNDGRNDLSPLNRFYADNFRGDVITDKNDQIIVGSVTFSSNFPYTAGSFGVSYNFGNFQKGVLFKLSADLKTLIFSSLLPGTNDDAIYSVDLNANDDIFIAGGTTADSLFANMTDTFNGGNCDGFIAKIKNDGSQVLNARYFGTSSYDQIFSLELDELENMYIVGQSEGSVPIKGNVYRNANSHQFIACIDKNFTGTLFSTVFGSGRNSIDLTINAFLVDNCGRIFVSGWGGGIAGSGSTLALPVTTNAVQTTTDGKDFYILVLGKDAKKVLFASFFGGNQSGDHVDGGTSRFDKRGFIYQSVCASCEDDTLPPNISDFPTTPNAAFTIKSSKRCSNAAFKIGFNFSEAMFGYVVDSCTGIITFESQNPDVIAWKWIFPNGQISTEEKPAGLINDFKDKPVTFIAYYGSKCSDTVTNTILFQDSIYKPGFPNVFTPNDDHINDVFTYGGLNTQCDKVSIEIYNRWGQLLFESKEVNFAWDGTDQEGNKVTEGVYFYMSSVEQRGQPVKTLHGTLMLLR